jgi:hypothetical protein
MELNAIMKPKVFTPHCNVEPRKKISTMVFVVHAGIIDLPNEKLCR